jgi:hypothetical protein
MIHIPEIGYKLEKSLKKGQIKLAHYPNKSLCWAIKNQIGQYLVFEFGRNYGYPPKIAVKFSKSNRVW